ncbi:hypothetical protein [Propylenella binzhouense]|uniref:Uncharacterized protein n=1 Tax=Propylenella binzhouense TaxID=2555902 RepID=A0A964WSU4_9HYPH|nr:hypothetical protein [Propylenella binzhouense]MYZ47332.1 hypothetical protein [Propylenella binzhouense]
MTASAFSPALHEWAAKHARRLADEWLAGDGCEREAADRFFESACIHNVLLGALRSTAEPAFAARIAEREADHG